MINKKTIDLLIEKAKNARSLAYSPYSKFCVGAALLCADGEIFVGANVENSSYGATICAERVAFSSALMQGERDFEAIAIVGEECAKEIQKYCPPCGICRQFMAEFCKKDFEIVLFDGKEPKVKKLSELLPEAFDGSSLI